MTQQRKPSIHGAFGVVGSWAARNGVAPRSGSALRAPI